MAHNNTPIKDVEKSQDDADASTEEMDIDSDSDIDSDIPLTSPLFSFTSRLATTGPSGPPPNIPLPPNSPHTSTTEDKDPNRTTIGQLPTYPSSLSIPLTKPLTLNLRQPTIPGSITVPSIIKTPASTPSPTVLTHQPRIKHQEHNALGIPCPRKGKADKAIPRYLSAAFQKFPFKGGDERLDGQKFEDGAVEPLRLGVKRGSVGGGEGDGGRGGSEVTEQVTHDLDVMLGLSKQKDGLEGYNGQQQPLIIGIASVGGPGAGLEAGPGDSDKKGEGDTSAADDDDIKDEEKSDAAGSAAGEEVLKKKKRRRTRGGGKKAAGTASPGRAPVGTPATPSASGDVGSFISIPVDLLLRPNEGVEPSWDDDEEEEQNRGGKGEGGGKAGSLPPPPPPPPFPPSPPKPTSSSHSAHDSSTLKAKSPFVPAPPAEKRVPPVKLEDRAPTMWSRPQGFEVPRREFDSQRLDRERADLEHLVRGDDERPGESPWGSNSRAAGGGITANDGTDALKSPKRLIDSLPPRKEITIPTAVLSFRTYARQPENVTNNDIQLGLEATEAAFNHSIEPSLLAAQESLRLRNQVQALQRAANATLEQLENSQQDVEKAAEMKAMQDLVIEGVQEKARKLEEEKAELERMLVEAREGNQKPEEKELIDYFAVKLSEAESELEVLKKEREEGGLISRSECEEEKAEIEQDVHNLEAVVETYDKGNMITREECARLSQDKEEVHAQRVEDLQADVRNAERARDALQARLGAAETAEGISEDAAGEECAEKIKELEDKIKDLEGKLAEKKDVPEGLVSKADCEKQNSVKVEKLEKQIKDMKARIRELITNAAPPTNSITLEQCAQQNAAANSRLEEKILKLEKENEKLESETKLLRDTLDTVRAELRDCRDSRDPKDTTNPGTKNDTLKERIAGLGERVTNLNELVDSQGAELSKRGISSNFQQLRMFEQHNGRLIEQNEKLTEEVKRLRSRKVASGYMSWDEKDGRITQLTDMINEVNGRAQFYYLQAEEIANKFNQLVANRANDVNRRVAIKLREMLQEQKEKEKKKTKTSSNSAKAATAMSDAQGTIDVAKQREIETIGNLARDREEAPSQVGNTKGDVSGAFYEKQLLQLMIKLVEQFLAIMVAARAINGKKSHDSLAAVRAAHDAISKAEKVKDDDLAAQASLWAGIAYFYHGNYLRSQFYIDQAERLKDTLQLDADKKILNLWIKYGVESKLVETRREGYNRNFKFVKRVGGNGRRTSSSTNSSAGSSIKKRPNKLKSENRNNDIPEFDDDGNMIGEDEDEDEEDVEDQDEESIEA